MEPQNLGKIMLYFHRDIRTLNSKKKLSNYHQADPVILTKSPEQLHAESCENEEKQKEEKSQISNLNKCKFIT